MRAVAGRLLIGLALAAGLGTGVPAAADTRWFFSVGVGVPAYRHHGHHWRGHHYGHHHRHHYRHYYGHYHRHHYLPYYRSTVIYAPPPVVYVQPPAPRETCARFNGNATVDRNGAPFHGVACLRGDGRWHIVPGG